MIKANTIFVEHTVADKTRAGRGLLYSCNGRKNVITGQKRDKTREGLIIRFHTRPGVSQAAIR